MKEYNNEYFFHTKTSPRTTIGGIYDPETKYFKLAKAVCGPNDQFCKKIGRAITIGRIKARKFSVIIKVLEDETPGQAFVQAALALTGQVNLDLVEA